MIDIAKRRMPTAVLGVLVYVSYCASSWYAMRGNLAYVGQQYGISGWLINDVVAFFTGGLLPFLLFWFITSFVYRPLAMKTGGDMLSVKYGLCLTVAVANLVLFAFKFSYIAYPLYAPIVNIIVDPAVTLLFVGLYMWYVFYQGYVQRSRFGMALVQILGTFAAVYGLLALFGMVMSVA